MRLHQVIMRTYGWLKQQAALAANALNRTFASVAVSQIDLANTHPINSLLVSLLSTIQKEPTNSRFFLGLFACLYAESVLLAKLGLCLFVQMVRSTTLACRGKSDRSTTLRSSDYCAQSCLSVGDQPVHKCTSRRSHCPSSDESARQAI